MAAARSALPSAAPVTAAAATSASAASSSSAAASASAAAAAGPHSPRATTSSAAHPQRAQRMSIAALADVTEQVFGSPNQFPGTPPSHFFPAVSRQDRERLRQARLAGEHEHLPSSSPAAQPAAARSPAFDSQTDDARWQRERQAKLNLAAGGPFDNRRPPQQQQQQQQQQSHHPDANSQVTEPLPGATSDAEAAAVRTLQAGAAVGVGAGGSGGTKRRYRDDDRTSWDAASELVRFERERDLADRTAAERNEAAVRKSSTGTLQAHPFPTVDREKTPTPNTFIPSTAKGKGRATDFQGDDEEARAMTDLGSYDGSTRRRRDSRVTDEAETSEGEDERGMDDEDAASVMTGATGRSAGGNGSDGSGKEPVKKRSRTLTTPAQTAVLNALLAKTRFPSTETREEVGRQIGMSARRVQIWFQNRRQSQKRQREREAQEELAASRAARAMMSAQAHHMVGYPVRVHTSYDPTQGGYVQAAQFYPPLQPKPSTQTEYVLVNNDPRPHAFETYQMVPARQIDERMYAASQQQQQVMLPIPPGDPRYPATYVTTAAAPGHFDEHGRLMQTNQVPVRVVPQPRPAPPQHSAQVFPSKLYFPHVARQVPVPTAPYHSAPPLQQTFDRPRQDRNDSIASSAGGDVRLPSLSSVFAASNEAQSELPDPRAYRPAVPPATPGEHAPMFSHSPFSPPPMAPATVPMQTTARQPPPNLTPLQSRAVFSPEPSSSFERLHISGEPPVAPSVSYLSMPPERSLPTPNSERPPSDGNQGQYSRDVLDMAVEAMADQSSRALPPRHVLPPLRSVLGGNSFSGDRNSAAVPSEADQALMAPIRPPGTARTDSSSGPSGVGGGGGGIVGGGQRLPSMSSSAGAVAAVPVSPSGQSTLSNASRTTLSTVASFDFGRPPAGSYRASQERDRSDATGGGLVQSNSNSTISPSKADNGAGTATATEEEVPTFWRNRGDSVGTGETSLSESADHAHGVPFK
ncbi:hypothetical protein JCM3774_001127 [Rhodotorula dairenensis]